MTLMDNKLVVIKHMDIVEKKKKTLSAGEG